MKLYTKTGDKGKTSLIGGRVSKDDLRVETYGTIDELNSFIGKAVTELERPLFDDIIADLETIQHELFDCGGDLANVMKERKYKLEEVSIEALEKRIDALSDEAPPLKRFILPGGSQAAATLHIARTVTRRAERQMVTLMNEVEDVPTIIQKYLNRLSDYFFAAARAVNARLNVKDVEYVRSGDVFK
ncbi:cob(I)alamin adenosyltransferase [Lysinibacillus composti]|uniref:Corrinoid adenosyltransferase n=1 Tax=Lysinibacillus composti TaxID=720633 RepID=A0A3N9USU1_9BACI|nr:cob(I)yrinic acid a,c-diamide adenosyltransferase [Lysinibacillus composti]MBM7608996.1 cob(I)alamin adenosyltransferase [Lysinibacillus composti]RQW75582.1 cob(I)yrinic acid a,c-diamide adenosyltransferase [Lysinibacillus composti]